jgi:hypothetical protein
MRANPRGFRVVTVATARGLAGRVTLLQAMTRETTLRLRQRVRSAVSPYECLMVVSLLSRREMDVAACFRPVGT